MGSSERRQLSQEMVNRIDDVLSGHEHQHSPEADTLHDVYGIPRVDDGPLRYDDDPGSDLLTLRGVREYVIYDEVAPLSPGDFESFTERYLALRPHMSSAEAERAARRVAVAGEAWMTVGPDGTVSGFMPHARSAPDRARSAPGAPTDSLERLFRDMGISDDVLGRVQENLRRQGDAIMEASRRMRPVLDARGTAFAELRERILARELGREPLGPVDCSGFTRWPTPATTFAETFVPRRQGRTFADAFTEVHSQLVVWMRNALDHPTVRALMRLGLDVERRRAHAPVPAKRSKHRYGR